VRNVHRTVKREDCPVRDPRSAWAAPVIGAATAMMFVATLLLGISRPSPLPSVIEPFGVGAFLLDNIPYLGFVAVGVLIASRRPEDPIGWMFAAAGFTFLFQGFATEYGIKALLAEKASLPGGAVMAWAGTWPWLVGVGLVLLLILLFPNGTTPSPRWRPLAWFIVGDSAAMTVGAASVLWGYRGPELLGGLDQTTVAPMAERIVFIGFTPLLLTLIPVAISVILRFRRARGDERQQLKWVAYAAALLVLSALISESFGGMAAPEITERFSAVTDAIGNLAIPVAATVAILKYRLYDIDRIINRTLVYGVLTAILAATYVVIVTVAGTFAGGSALITAAATLAVAALFQPLRRRTQGFIDRRFYRSRFDATRTVEAFSSRLRDEVDLEAMRSYLLTAVVETMHPQRTSLWLRG
jgi:hypothetical protein